MVKKLSPYCQLLIIIAMMLQGCTGHKGPMLLKYDDGKMDESAFSPNMAHAVHFTKPAGDYAIKGVRFFGRREGAGQGNDRRIVLTICDKDAQPISEYSLFQSIADTNSEKWRNFNVNPEILCPDDFWVFIDTNSIESSSILMGMDYSVKVSHSGLGDPGSIPAEVDRLFDWMIRVELEKLDKEGLERLTGGSQEQ